MPEWPHKIARCTSDTKTHLSFWSFNSTFTHLSYLATWAPNMIILWKIWTFWWKTLVQLDPQHWVIQNHYVKKPDVFEQLIFNFSFSGNVRNILFILLPLLLTHFILLTKIQKWPEYPEQTCLAILFTKTRKESKKRS